MKSLALVWMFFLVACAGSSKGKENSHSSQETPPSATANTEQTAASPSSPPLPQKTKSLKMIEWDGPCGRRESGKEKVAISGFNLQVTDVEKKVLAKKFIPVKKNDPYACGKYAIHFKSALPQPLAAALDEGSFKGRFEITTVAVDKRESPPSFIEIH